MNINLTPLAQRPFPIRLGIFILTLLLLWLPIAAPIYLLVKNPNLVTIFTMVPLAIEFLILLPFWGKYVHQQPKIFQHYGLELTRKNKVELLRGLAIGFVSILILFSLEGLLGWLVWQQTSSFQLRFVLEGIVTALGTAFAEELFFRGWMYDELQRDYNPSVVLWATATIFAVAHFIKPLSEVIRTSPQFFGLLLLGLALVWAKRRCQGRLGFPIGIHAGLVWGWYIINVGQLVKYSGRVPDWVTGVNNNPLAGVMGLVFMGVLVLWMRGRGERSRL
ncbi:CPBP family intramembrane glutamic endopeptidase [Chlorogloeopsis fritschii PCC 9212]|uniref:CAAX protease family protein n=1 Tax=Chlorogloeopsis fritschii PCC 6912 TaxID=211165 RepID=A0A3S0Y4R9_CHLFR|nr:type II CAAX endopeptidase family protein [Chlorogloeopsis fritschii]RUR85180.1 CAAX protease family protein [Chlorogloeopsis fritschii PCC 6912]